MKLPPTNQKKNGEKKKGFYFQEHNQKRVKRVVGFVAIAMTLLSLALVAFSLALGRKIDLMGQFSFEFDEVQVIKLN